MCVRTRFHCLCGFSAGFRQDRIIPRGPQIAPLLSSPFFSSVIYRTDTSERNAAFFFPMQKYIWELDLWFLFACDKPMRFLSLFQRRRASPSIHYDSIYLGGPHVCVCNPKVMNFERFVMRFGPPRIMRFHRPSSFFTTAAGDKGHAMDGIDPFM